MWNITNCRMRGWNLQKKQRIVEQNGSVHRTWRTLCFLWNLVCFVSQGRGSRRAAGPGPVFTRWDSLFLWISHWTGLTETLCLWSRWPQPVGGVPASQDLRSRVQVLVQSQTDSSVRPLRGELIQIKLLDSNKSGLRLRFLSRLWWATPPWRTWEPVLTRRTGPTSGPTGGARVPPRLCSPTGPDLLMFFYKSGVFNRRASGPRVSCCSSLSGRQLCNGTTKTGKACKKRAVPGQEFCRVHEGGHASYALSWSPCSRFLTCRF